MRTKVLFVAVLLVAVLIPLKPAVASDAYEIYWEWYSDASKTEVVGWRQENCGGTADYDGYQTAYFNRWVGERCSDGGGGGWQTWCSIPSGYVCPAQCAWCTYY